jgi:hypothetical protein
MANNFDSNFTRKLARVFLEKFDSQRVLSKNVDTQLLQGKFDPSTGDTVDFKRPTDYISQRTANGDISGTTASSIITGKASGVVQDYFTVEVDYDEADEAIKMDQIDQLLAPMATRIKTDFEVDFANFMMKNSGLKAGVVGNGAKTWDEIAEAGALMQSVGIPMDMPWCYAVNPYTQRSLASDQRSLGSVDPLISEAHKKAIISDNFAGMKVMTATTLSTFTTGTGADRAGTVVGVTDSTYLTAKDTMTQTIGVTAFEANLVVAAGEQITVTAASGAIQRLNQSTRTPILDENGSSVLWTGTVTAAVTLNGSGAGNLIVTGPAIFEAAGQYNTVSQAIAASDVITLAGVAATTYQPNLFWHKQAFSVGSVPIKKLYSTDTIATTEDGLQIRVSKGTSFRENKQQVRFDFRPAYGVMNPNFAGQGYGTA